MAYFRFRSADRFRRTRAKDGMDQGSDFICDLRAMLSLSRHVPSKFGHRPFAGPLVVAVAPLWPARLRLTLILARTRLSHRTPFSGRDWCTRERCPLMMRKSRNFPEFPADDSKNFAASSRFFQDFPRIFRESRTTLRARARHPHTHR